MDKSFFLDIFNQILKYGEHEISIIFDSNGDVWFGLRDTLKVLDYKNYKKALQNIYISKNNRKKYKYIGVPIAKLFMNKYFTEIMPQIRKTGKYEVSKKEMRKIKNLNQKLNNYKKELSHHEKKDYEKSKNGYFYISEDITIHNGKEIKCFKIGYCKDIHKRMKVYKVGHYKHKLISYIPIVLDGKQLESCVKTKMRIHLKKIASDTLCFTTLQKLKKEITSCNDFIKEHLCHCLSCKKKYKLKNIDKHLCNKKINIVNI